MKKTLLLSAFAMAILWSGCTREMQNEEASSSTPSENPVTLTVKAVTKGANPDSKIVYGTADATWETGDKIFLIKSDGTTITLHLQDGAGTSTGYFTSNDAVVAGTYIPYAVSATSLAAGYVSLSEGVITLNLSTPGGGTLADALAHDILKGTSVTLTDGQGEATITGLTTHMLSYLRFRFTCASKSISKVGLSSAGGINQTVTIAANGTASGSNPTTNAIYVTAGDDGADVYSGYFAVFGSTSTSLVAFAEDEDGGKYGRLVSVKTANYTAGKTYGKIFSLSRDMVSSTASGTLSAQTWVNAGLSVRWAKFNVGSSIEYDYSYNISNGTPDSEGIGIPDGWNGWRIPSRTEAQELFYACNRTWVPGEKDGVKFDCNGNYIAMGAGGYWRQRNDSYTDQAYSVGSVCFFINECTASNGWYAQYWAMIGEEGTSFNVSYSNLGTNVHDFYNFAALRLVCDYSTGEGPDYDAGNTEAFTLGENYDSSIFE